MGMTKADMIEILIRDLPLDDLKFIERARLLRLSQVIIDKLTGGTNEKHKTSY